MELFKYCKYYRGERECPFKKGQEYDYWLIEKAWVEHSGDQTDAVMDSIIRFCNSPFRDITNNDGLPISLAAAILDYYEKKTEGMYRESDFLNYYENYKKRKV